MGKFASPSWAYYEDEIQSPLLILVHGGGFIDHGETVQESVNPANFEDWQDFSRDTGITVATIGYRLATPSTPSFPGVLYDIKLAYDYLVNLHNPSSVTFLGASAGANVALMGVKKYDIPAKFIGFYGLYDLREEDDFTPEINGNIDTYIGTGAYSRVHASPIRLDLIAIEGFLIHGTNDTHVSINQSQALSGYTGWALESVPENHAFNIFDYADSIKDFVD